MTGHPEAVDFSARVLIPETVLMQELEGEAVLLHLDAGEYFGLDLVGTRMWQLLASSSTIQSAYDQLLEEYEVDADRLRIDLERMVAELSEKRLIEIV